MLTLSRTSMNRCWTISRNFIRISLKDLNECQDLRNFRPKENTGKGKRNAQDNPQLKQDLRNGTLSLAYFKLHVTTQLFRNYRETGINLCSQTLAVLVLHLVFTNADCRSMFVIKLHTVDPGLSYVESHTHQLICLSNWNCGKAFTVNAFTDQAR